ncbi:MAG: enoyl-CoA hydratase [Elusimicrobia bacterium CG_4_10_14_0_2_um_filter_56_8]|nr:MAG: enoyl-CoA hydratase [Elusimicrobia bacterium CG1_02_56_21]PJA13458.1 MAG: enoyl-CoA hydratase [Elusimicrobia bacterium CG_4_10_14_0_2_um_filter_56_8]
MKTYQTIESDPAGAVGTIWLARPATHNAFNETMIAEITDCFKELSDSPAVRIIVLRGRGKSFCAGADLNWLKSAAKYTREENYDESLRLARCFYSIYTSKKPTVCVVHGSSIGGANGLAAACDFAYCTGDTVFSLSEVKIGVVPACISPYVVKRLGEYGARDLMLTGRRVKGTEAQACGLVNKSFETMADLEAQLGSLVKNLLTSGPDAIGQCKKLIYDVSNVLNLDTAVEHTAKVIAEIRTSPEAQEGMAAFLEKRKPSWVKE